MIRALVWILLTGAIIHILILLVQSTIHFDYTQVNVFSIIYLSKVWPELGEGLTMAIISWILAAVLFGLFYLIINQKERTKNPAGGKVFYDARFIDPERLDGVGRYSLELLKAYAQINPDVTMIIYDEKQLARLPKLPYVILDNPYKFKQLRMSLRLNRLGAGVVFCPQQIFSGFGRRFKLILSLHDTIYYQFRRPPNWISLSDKVIWRLMYLTPLPHRLLLNQANVVVTVSKASRDDLMRRHLTDRPIEVVYNAPAELKIIPAKTQKTLVYMGSFMGYKNVETLIAATNELPDYELILCSKIDPKRKEELMRGVPKTSKIIWKNGISDDEYAKILSSATALVSASRAEGFNLSPIEAISVGVPVIISDLPVHHEIAGDAALFFNPDKPTELAKNVRKLEDGKLRSKMITAGYEQAGKFSWQKSAEKLNEVINSLQTK